MHAVDRPREKIARMGASALSDRELIAAILGSGGAGHDVWKIADKAARRLDRISDGLALDHLSGIPGLGIAKISQLIAAIELGRRRGPARLRKITKPEDLLPLVAFIASKPQEYLVCVSLNGAGESLATHVVTIGILSATQVHPREVFARAIEERAAAVIVAHNHPSGSASPSSRDRKLTRHLVDAGELLGIPVLDHLILTEQSFHSMRRHHAIRFGSSAYDRGKN